METKFTSKTGWVTFLSYKGVKCFREWGHVKPTRKQLRKFMKRTRVRLKESNNG